MRGHYSEVGMKSCDLRYLLESGVSDGAGRGVRAMGCGGDAGVKANRRERRGGERTQRSFRAAVTHISKARCGAPDSYADEAAG